MSSTTGSLAATLKTGDRRALAQAITLVESTRPDDRASATALLADLGAAGDDTIRVGISGVPGVGKSTFIERIGNHVIDAGHRVAVLAVDPTSTVSGGSILGDKTRMPDLTVRDEAFIRPSPAGTTLGGVTRRTREAIVLCEAARFDVVIVETVGVGQSETAVADMTDMFVLMLLPGGGDELQGIKRGIIELADLIVVNKADGEMEKAAGRSAADYLSALQFMRSRADDWKVPVKTCSALTGSNIAEVWSTIVEYHRDMRTRGTIAARRAEQARSWMWAEAAESLLDEVRGHPEVAGQVELLERDVMEGKVPAIVAAAKLLRIYRGDG